jgi:ribosomal protein L32E
MKEFEMRHLEVKAQADREKLEKEAERAQMAGNRGEGNERYRNVDDFAKYKGQPLRKSIKEMELVQDNAVNTIFVCRAHPDHIEDVLLENLRDVEKVDPKISSEKYKLSFTLTTTDQGGIIQNSGICIKLHKVDDEHTAVEF